MKSTSFKMNRQRVAFIIPALLVITLLGACNKWDLFGHDGKNSPGTYSAEVIDKWITLQLRLMKNATGIPNQAFSRHYAYTGVAALESIAPGVPEHQQWQKKWNGLTGLPQAGNAKQYYWPANVNAALAAINKSLFPNASATDKAAIDSLEIALKQQFLTKIDASKIAVSEQYGKAVAAAVFAWADADGYKNASAPYTPPVGPGLWKPTPPTFGPAATPYWGNNRPIIKGSLDNTLLPSPIAYSTEVGSPFYNMVKEVYDAKNNATADQQAMAIYWRDVPGVSSPGHWESVLQQTIRIRKTSLAKACLAYALTGIGTNDALIACWKAKYTYNLVRPVTYVRDVMGDTAWNSSIATPAHPEYPSAHSALSGGAAEVMEVLFGNIYSITDHTYDYMGLTPRTYTSFTAIAKEAGDSRVYGGIHYRSSCETGLAQGKKVASNIFKAGPFFPAGFDLE